MTLEIIQGMILLQKGEAPNHKLCKHLSVKDRGRGFSWSSQQAFCNLIGQRGPIVQLIINEIRDESGEGQCPAFP